MVRDRILILSCLIFILFALSVPCGAQTGCTYTAGQGVPEPEASAFRNAYNRAGGLPVLGCPTSPVRTDGFPSFSRATSHYQPLARGASINYHATGERAGQAYVVAEPIYSKWQSLGFTSGNPLGFPIGDLSAPSQASTGTRLQYQPFEGGAIEWHQSGRFSGRLFEIHGAIYTRWGQFGYANWFGGLPITDEFDAPRSRVTGRTGRVNEFERGHIFWIREIDRPFSTIGDINILYATMGSSGSSLGFPTSDEFVNPCGRAQSNFENGQYITTLDGREYRVFTGCTYAALDTTSRSFTADSGFGTFQVTKNCGCSWTAQTTADWISIISGSGSGIGNVTFRVSPNLSTSERRGTITVSGQTFQVIQAGARPTTIFIVHGIAQNGGEQEDMGPLARNLRDALAVWVPSRFVVDVGYNFRVCANDRNCPSDCTLGGTGGVVQRNGAKLLAQHIDTVNPSGDIVIIGYSLGGLVARDMIVNRFSRYRVRLLITLGTPNLGYPNVWFDEYTRWGRCGPLVRQMFGDFRGAEPNPDERQQVFTDRDGISVTLSEFLALMNRAWVSRSPSELPRWVAIGGGFCPTDPEDPSQWTRERFPVNPSPPGCDDDYIDNDGVVCQQSALFDLNISNTPDNMYPAANFAHVNNFGSLVLFCGNWFSQHPNLYNPPISGPDVDVFNLVLKELVTLP